MSLWDRSRSVSLWLGRAQSKAIQIMVGALFITPLEEGTIFRNITSASFASCRACLPLKQMDILEEKYFYKLETEIVLWRALALASHRHPDRLFCRGASQYPTACPLHPRCWIPKTGAVSGGASIWILLGKPVAWDCTWMECSSATNPRIQTP